MMKPDPNTAWAALVLAGLFEVGFTTAMTLSQQGKRWGDLLFLVCITASFALLHYSTKTIPLGIGYAVWTGIGAAGTLAVSTLVFKAPIGTAQIALVLVLIAVVAGLKLTSPH
jgi:quaternary ammonium compound-resistance protein SugE